MTITTRAGKGSQLTWAEVDENFNGLETNKANESDLTALTTRVSTLESDVSDLVTNLGDATTDFVTEFESAMV